MSLPADIVLYFISESDGNVYALDTCQREPRKVADLNSTQRQDRLYLAEVQADTGRCELMANVEVHDADGWTWKDVPTGITCPAATLSRDGEETSYEVTNGIGEVPRLGPSAESGWRFRCGFWPFEGLYGENHKTGRTSDVSLETPFVAWYVRYATQIPGGKVVFQLSDRRSCQICLLDPEEKKITLLAKGRGPAVAWRESEGERPLPNGTPNPDSEAQNQMEAKAMPEKAAAK
jgi:hypothetical protein